MPIRPRVLGKWVLVTVALLGAFAVASTSAQGATTDDICQAAHSLTTKGLPQHARRLLGAPAATSGGCLEKRLEEADAAIAKADVAAKDALSKLATDPEAARTRAEDAEKDDAENATLIEVKAALPAKPAATDPQSGESRWDDFVDRYLDPLQTLGIPFLAIITGLILLARLGSALPCPWPNTGQRTRRAFWALGVLLGGACSALFVTVLPGKIGASAWLWLAFIVLLGLGSAAILTLAIATRMRLAIEVRKTDVEQAATGHVIALLADLGASPPTGLETPRGADETALEGTPIAGTPEGRIVTAFTRVWRLLLGSTPWRMRIDVESDDLHSFVMTRNGHTVASGVINRDSLGLRSPIGHNVEESADGADGADGADASASEGGAAQSKSLPDLHRFAAAAVLVTLASHYRDLTGLFGVTDWRSLGLHYVATTDYALAAAKAPREEALGRALNHDPRNIPALVALRRSIYDDPADEDALQEYLRWLRAMVLELDTLGNEGSTVDALRLRVLATRAAVASNLKAARGGEAAAQDRLASGRLIRLLKEVSRAELDPLARTMRPRAASTYLYLHDLRPEDAAAEPETKTASEWLSQSRLATLSPRGHYDFACYAIQQLEDPDEAIRHLKIASVDPALGKNAEKDPALKELRAEAIYKKAFPHKPRADYTALAPLAKHAGPLKEAGLDSAAGLASVKERRLARYLKIDRLVAARFIALAQMSDDMPVCLDPFRVEITASLLEEGIASTERVSRITAEEAEPIATKIAEGIAERCQDGLTDDQRACLASWLGQGG